jgi:hypothetical protein
LLPVKGDIRHRSAPANAIENWRHRHLAGAAVGQPAAERVAELSYLELQQQDDTVQRHAVRRYSAGRYLRHFPDEPIEAFPRRGSAGDRGDRGEGLPSVGLQAYGGAIAEVPEQDTAFSHRDTLIEYGATVSWGDPVQDQEQIGAA